MTPQGRPAADSPRRGLILSGGGARGAYEAGVLAYIFNELPEVRHPASRLRILSGTSVGAINASFVASRAHLPNYDIDRLSEYWRSLRLADIVRLGTRDFLRLPFDVRALWRQSNAPHDGLLLNTSALLRLITEEVDWRQIRRNMAGGHLDAVTASTTHIASGKTVVFVDNDGRELPAWGRDTRRVARGVTMGARHALASAAIPILFPAVNIDGAYFCDGGLRQNTPVSPALRLGADRALVVAVGHGRGDAPVPEAGGVTGEPYPGLALLLGKVFNALLLDHLDYDLAQLQGFNQLLDDGRRAFGPAFAEELGQSATGIRGQRYRQVDSVVVRPSRDLGQIAAEMVRRRTIAAGGFGGWLLRQLADSDAGDRADLLSYLLFEGRFAHALIELGMADADAQREALREFFRA